MPRVKRDPEKENRPITGENKLPVKVQRDGKRQAFQDLKPSTKKAKVNNHTSKASPPKKPSKERPKDSRRAAAEQELTKRPKETVAFDCLYEYKNDIWNYLMELEREYTAPRSKYMSKQPELNWKTRSILINWLATTAKQYNVSDEAFHMSVNFLDRALTRIQVARRKFQLVGAASMLLAGKMQDVFSMEPNDWSFITDDTFTSKQVRRMECLLIKVLECKLQPPTMYTFIVQFCFDHDITPKTTCLALYLSELVLLQGQEYLNYSSSMLAAASVALARYTLFEKQPWPKQFQNRWRYTLEMLSPVLKEQQKTFENSACKGEQAIRDKYKSDAYHGVALVEPRNLIIEDFSSDNL